MSCAASQPRRVVILGPPAAGKGTQGRKLAKHLKLGYLSTGMVLRDQVAKRTPLGEAAAPILDRGGYLPDDLMNPLLAEWLDGREGGWILDGFPRSLAQAEFLTAQLAVAGERLDAAVFLEVPFEVLLQRTRDRVECLDCHWSGCTGQLGSENHCPECGSHAGPRSDDGEENFRNRHAEFERLTQPAIAYYRQRGLLCPCVATASQDEVAARLLRLFPGDPD